MLTLLEPLRAIPGPGFLALYVIAMIFLPMLTGRRWAGVALLAVGGAKCYLAMHYHKPAGILIVLLIVTLFTHILSDWEGGSSGGSCSGGGFFFFGGGGCGSSCGSSCGGCGGD